MRLLYAKIPYRVSESVYGVRWSWPQIVCPYHYHTEVELVWIEKSQGRMSLGDYQGSFDEGDLFLIGSNVPHVFYNTAEHRSIPGASKALVIQFPPDFLGEKTWRTPELIDVGHVIRLAKQGMRFVGGERSEIISKMKRFLKSSGALRMALLLEILNEWTVEKNREILMPLAGSGSAPWEKDTRFQKILNLLADRLNQRITLPDLSRKIHMTPSSLSRLFKQKMGIALVDYINTQRVTRSCELLAGTDLSVTEIAFEVGFENLSNFNRQFLRRKQCTPKAFRAVFKEKGIKIASHLPENFHFGR